MATATTTLNLTEFGYVNSEYPSTHYQIDPTTWYQLYRSTTNVIPQPYMFAKLSAFPSALKRNQLRGIQFNFQVDVSRNGEVNIYRSNDFDDATITWYTKPTFDKGTALENFIYTFRQTHTGNALIPETLYGTTNEVLVAAYILQSSALCLAGGNIGFKLKTVLENGDPITAVVSYDDAVIVTSRIAYKSGPKSGYANPRNDITFSWDYNPFGYCADPTWGQTSATFYWKKSADENYTAVPAGTSKSVTIPANRFPTNDTISWYVEGTDDEGTTSQTEVFSFSTAAGAVSTNPITPKDTIESNNEEITFRWSYESADGFPPGRQLIQYKETADVSWTTIEELTNAETTYAVAANTFPAGDIVWRVIPYNIDDVEGIATTASFVSYGAPEAPTVYATSTPFMTVTWQANGQQAYEIKVGEKFYGAYFGTEKEFNVPDVLDDGTYEVKVRVVGAYNLWSAWGSTTVEIQNTPSEAITLTGASNIDAVLSWTTEEETSDFHVYRDGAEIGHTVENSFTDRFALGTHTYKVINKLYDDNYSASNEIVLDINPSGTYISELNGNQWLNIKYALKSQSDPSYSENRQNSYNHLAGDTYPTAILSRYQQTNMSFSAVFLYTEKAENDWFNSMFGKPVVLKLEDGAIYVGVLDSWTKQSKKKYYTSYTFTIQRIEWEDYVDDSGNTL